MKQNKKKDNSVKEEKEKRNEEKKVTSNDDKTNEDTKKEDYITPLISTSASCSVWNFCNKNQFVLSLITVCILTVLTRGYKIDQPAHICWDETHFGKFANHYLNGTFFFDVHPPLGKMLLALAGWFTGYDGSFPFDKPGDQYGDHNYVGMRVFCAALGGFCVPLAFLTVWELTHSVAASVLTACFILFDTGCITISQYILLDPPLMFFVMLSIYSLVKFQTWSHSPFSFDWWGWMLCTGYFLACAFSVKWVGLFVILFAGLSTVQDLWNLVGDLSLSVFVLIKHLLARVFGLIIVPIMVYLSFFGLHFQFLPYSGPGDGFFSTAFQSTLIGNQLNKAKLPAVLAYGASITIKNYQSSGTLLHSHSALYPKEHPPQQQQITGYSHKDMNNNWKVHKPDSILSDTDPVEYVRNGDIIRLMHVPTMRNLHSHNEKAAISDNLMQVSGYGERGVGDTNDNWRIEVIKSGGEKGIINTVKTVFRLIHVNTGCALTETGNTLPKWGFEQREMACNPITYHEGTSWNIESNAHQQVPEVSIKLLAPTFLESVYESHIIMAKTNNGFKPKEGEFHSQAWHWPINYRGQVFSGGDFRVYLLGNPIIWWFILTTYVIYVTYFLLFEIRSNRGYEYELRMKVKSKRVIKTCAWLLVGWSLHYFPFYLMGRVLYFHHYFPAFLISTMFSGILLEHLIEVIALTVKNAELKDNIYFGCLGFICFGSVFSFYLFRDLTYGMSGPTADQANVTMAAYKWLETWEL